MPSATTSTPATDPEPSTPSEVSTPARPESALSYALQQRWRELRDRQEKLGDGNITAGMNLIAWVIMGILVIIGMLGWLLVVNSVMDRALDTWSFWKNWGSMVALHVGLLSLGVGAGAALALHGQRALIAGWTKRHQRRRARQRLTWNQWWWSADDAYRQATDGCLSADPDLHAYSVVRTGDGSWVHVVEYAGQVWLVDDQRRLVHRRPLEQ